MSEARTDQLEGRLDRLEEDVREIKATLVRLEPMINRIDATLPFLATKVELANLRTEVLTELARKPTQLYLWGVMGAMVGGQAVILAAAALALVILQTRPAPAPAPHASSAGIVLVGMAFGWDHYTIGQPPAANSTGYQRPRRLHPGPT